MKRKARHPRIVSDNRDYFLNIAKSIDNGGYFKEAFGWYKEVCLLPVCERSYLMLVTAAAAFAFSVTVINLQILGASSSSIPFTVKVEQGSSMAHYTHRLSDDIEESPQLSVANFMVATYVESTESYSPDLQQSQNFAAQFRKIKTMSSKDIFSSYRAYMSPLNPNSPLKRYQDHTRREIEINSIEYSNNYLFSTHATVRFTAREYSVKDPAAQPAVSRWTADLHFHLSDIESIARSGAPIKFQVTSYTTRKQ